MAYSATLMPNIFNYIGEFLYLHIQTHLYKQLLDYANITQMVNTITKPGFEDLDFLILKARLIPKTMVFVDKIDNAIALAAHLRSLLLLEQCYQGEILICTYHLNLETSTQSMFLENFWIGEIQI